jgi:hypothetical protein
VVTDHIGLRGPRPLRVSIRPVGTPRSLPSVFMCRLLSYTFCVNILILKRYYKVFILFFQYYIFIIFFNKNNEIIKTNDLTRKRVEEQGSRKKRENKHETWDQGLRKAPLMTSDNCKPEKTHRRDGLAVEDYDGAAQGHIFPWHHARWWFTRGGRAKLSLKTFTKTKSYCCGFHKRSPTAKERTQGNKLVKQKPPTAEAIKGSRTTPTWCCR